MTGRAFLWDSCVLYRWLNGVPNEYVDHIGKYLDESRGGHLQIFYSTITLAEVRPSKVNKPGLTAREIIDGVNGTLIPVTPSPDIMDLAGRLRDARYRHINGPEKQAAQRDLSLGDAIHLATGIALREEYGVQGLALHTFDRGKRKDSEAGKKTVPLIGYENWCRDCKDDEDVQRAIDLPKLEPEHPLCKRPTVTNSPASEKLPEN